MTENRIRALRRERGMTLDQLAAKIPSPPSDLKVGKATLSKFELGQRRLTAEWADVIAAALGVGANDLCAQATDAPTSLSGREPGRAAGAR